jgi:hypothetical protein
VRLEDRYKPQISQINTDVRARVEAGLAVARFPDAPNAQANPNSLRNAGEEKHHAEDAEERRGKRSITQRALRNTGEEKHHAEDAEERRGRRSITQRTLRNAGGRRSITRRMLRNATVDLGKDILYSFPQNSSSNRPLARSFPPAISKISVDTGHGSL